MKKSLILAAILVLALTVSAAAEVKLSGRVRFFTDDILADEITWGNDYRLNISGNVTDNSGISIRFENGTIDVDETAAESKVAVATVLKRANYWTNTAAGKVVVGQQFDDLSGLNINYAGTNMTASFTGVGLYPKLAEGVTAFAFYNPSAKQFGAQAKGEVAGATVWGGVSKAEADADMKFAVGASYPVVPDVLTVYGQYDAQGDVKKEFVGASGNLAGVDVAFEYEVEGETWALDFTKKFGDVEFNATYADDETLTFYTTVYF